jgi:tetratricopeptide (TPR) repeat protein
MFAPRGQSALMACLLFLASARAAAQEHATPPEALQYFANAREHYRLGRYPQAAADLERAIMLDPSSATLHYNLARVYELMSQLPQALEHYRVYVGLLPASEGEERERTQAAIQRLQGAIQSGGTPPISHAQNGEAFRELEGPVLVRERGVADLAFWLTIGGGGAALIAAAITGGFALERASARDALVLTDPMGAAEYRSQYDSMNAQANALGISTDVLFGVGGAAIVAGILLFALREQDVEREIVDGQIALVPFFGATPQGAIAGLRGAL